MKNVNLSPYLAYPGLKREVSFMPNRGDLADSLYDHLVRAVGPDGNPMEVLSHLRCFEEIQWALRFCRDPRNVRDVADELAWWAPITVCDHVISRVSYFF